MPPHESEAGLQKTREAGCKVCQSDTCKAQVDENITIPDSWQGKLVSYHVYNVHGSLMKQKISSNAGQTELLNIADLPVGIYVVKAINGDQASVQRIVKLNN